MLQQRQNMSHNRSESDGRIEETQQKSDRFSQQQFISSQNPRITLSLHYTPELSTSTGTLNPVSSSQSFAFQDSANSFQNHPVSEENSQVQQNEEITTGQNSQRQIFSSISQFNQNPSRPSMGQQETGSKQEQSNGFQILDNKSKRPSHFHSSQYAKKIDIKGQPTLMPLPKQSNLAFHCLSKITEKTSKKGIISLNHPLSLPRTSKEKEHSTGQASTPFVGIEDKLMYQKYNIAVRNAGNAQTNLGPKISSVITKPHKKIRDALLNKLLAMKSEEAGGGDAKKSLETKVPKIIIEKPPDESNPLEDRLLVKVNNSRMKFGIISTESGKISAGNSQHKRASVSTQSSLAKQQIDLTDERLYYFTRGQRQTSDHILSRSSQIISSKQDSQLLSSQQIECVNANNERSNKNNKAASNIARIAGNFSTKEEGNNNILNSNDTFSANVASNLTLKQRLFGQSVNFSLKSSFQEDSRTSQQSNHQYQQRARQKLHASNAFGFHSSQPDASSLQQRGKKRSSFGHIDNLTLDDNFSLSNQSNRRTQKQILSRTNNETAPPICWCSSLERKLNLSLDKNGGKEQQLQEPILPKQDKLQIHFEDTPNNSNSSTDGQVQKEKEEEGQYNQDKFKDIISQPLSSGLITGEYTKEEEFNQIQKLKQHKYLPLTIKKVIEQPYFLTMKIISNGLLHRDPHGPLITATEQDIVSLFQRLLEAQQSVTTNNADPFRKILSSPSEIAKRIESKLNEITTAILAIDKAKNGDTKLSRVANHFFDAFSYLRFIFFSTETSYLNNSIANSLNNLANSNNSRQLPLLTYLSPSQLRLRLYHNNFSKFFLPQDFLVLLEYVIFADLDGIRMKAEGFLHRLIQNRLAGMSENMEQTVKKIFDIEQEYLFAKQAPHRMKEIFSIKTPSFDRATSNSHAPEIYDNLKKIQAKSAHDKSDSLFQVNSLMDALTNNLSRNLKKYQISSPYSADIDPNIKKEIVEMYNTRQKQSS